MQDKVYSKPQPHIVDFAFNDAVADVFPDMIRRSVPGYETIIPMSGLIAARHLGDAGLALDLGCSLGATIQAMLAQTQATDIKAIGIDSSEPMISRAQNLNRDQRAKFIVADIQDHATREHFDGAKVILLNFVLQFFEPESRLHTLQTIRQDMSSDGMVIVSEKVAHSDPQTHEFFDSTHLAWKQANGYSELEVSQKRSALENVMRVDTIQDHLQRFTSAGFRNTTLWYQCMNWISFILRP